MDRHAQSTITNMCMTAPGTPSLCDMQEALKNLSAKGLQDARQTCCGKVQAAEARWNLRMDDSWAVRLDHSF